MTYDEEPPPLPDPPPAAITVTLDLNQIWVGRGDSLMDVLLERVAEQMLRNAVARESGDGEHYYHSLRARVESIRNEMIRERLAPIIEAEMTAPLQRTNDYGKPIGDPITLVDEVREAAQKWLTAQTPNQYDRTPRPTRLQEMIAKSVDAAMTKEFAAEINAGKEQIRKVLRDKAAALLADAIEKTAMGK